MSCANESVLIPMQAAGRWATSTDPIVEEEIWVRATDATRLAEGFIARALAGERGLLPEFQPRWHLPRPAAALIARAMRADLVLSARFRRLTCRPAEV